MASVEIGSDRELKFERGTRMTASALAFHLAGSLRRLNIEGAVVLLALVIGWQLASFYLPPILFPSLSKIATALRDIMTSPAALTAIGLTYLRIVAALAIAFAAATAVGIGAGLARPLERAALPRSRSCRASRRSAGSSLPFCGFATWNRASPLS